MNDAVHAIERLILGHRIRKLHIRLYYKHDNYLVELIDLPGILEALEYVEDMSIECNLFSHFHRQDSLVPVSLQVNFPRIKRLNLG